jgi:rhodanese-related sulfurtransferase
MSFATMSAREVKQEMAGLGGVLIDVRTPGEFAGEHAENAVNLPLDRLSADAVRAMISPGQKAYVICKSGKRAGEACERLMASGLVDVVRVEGGTDAWVAAGLPSVKGRGVISLERQVRIGAGLLVLIGVVLGLTVSPYGFALSGFVGAGLIFAGVTDWCGMALVLGKMPWNAGSKHGASCARR